MNYYTDNIALKLDEKGFITEILLNTHKDFSFEVGDSCITIFDAESYSAYYEYFSQVKEGHITFGFQARLKNRELVHAFLMKSDQSITLFTVSVDMAIAKLFDDLVEINNEQVRSVRDLYKKLQNKNENHEFLEEIMIVNNELINTRRELANKNKQLERLNQELHEINDTDYLTQIYNRRRFFSDIYKFVSQEDYILVMMDFNNFKIINDEFGHNKGDEALLLFTNLLKDEVMQFDGTLYRLGGDEFAILLSAAHEPDIAEIFHKVNDKLREFHPKIGLSYGTVFITKDNCNEHRKAEISMNLADQQMFEMKQAFYQENDFKNRSNR